jgi:hypothetical protein
MARYLPVLRIVVSHDYLAGAPLGLRFVPAAASSAAMLREDIVLRPMADGAELWRVQDAPQAAPEQAVPLAFAVYGDDPQLAFCTDWPVAPPLRYVGGRDGAELRAETLAGSGAPRQPVFSVEIEVPPASVPAVPALCRITLAARKIHWKYFFSGSLADRKLRIVDLDALDGGAGIGFVPSPPGLTDGGAAFLSEAALPMQKIPQQRLQLREEGGAGKVLIRRLPNANLAKLGKERGRDGVSMIVAEIYIHQ